MKLTSVNGTSDYLPAEAELRDYLQSVILKTYQECGFRRIMTPILEDAENLDKSEGGENLNLIFKVLKRGDKLKKAVRTLTEQAGDAEELPAAAVNGLSDVGLRYDLTLPLSRYYACHKAKLPLPLKCIQIDRAFRAERPQKGRMREFIQCDIDIIGSASETAEIELITVTAKALLNIGIGAFRIRVNDRRILRGVLLGLGFAAETLDTVCLSFDKLDKIGAEGVKEELLAKELPETSVERLVTLIAQLPIAPEALRTLCTDEEALAAMQTVETILQAAQTLANGAYEVVFDLSLVRGQGYYTGTVFEVESLQFRGAVGGGGRYDNLIGKFSGEQVPAVGFSIGFERIFCILSENGYRIPKARTKLALFYRAEEFAPAFRRAETLREAYDVTLFEQPKKLGKFLERLTEQQYGAFLVFGQSEEIKPLS